MDLPEVPAKPIKSTGVQAYKIKNAILRCKCVNYKNPIPLETRKQAKPHIWLSWQEPVTKFLFLAWWFFFTKLKSCCMGGFVEPSIIALHTSVLLNLENVCQLNQQRITDLLLQRRLFSYYEKDWNSPRLPHFQQPTLHGGFTWRSVHTMVSVQLRLRATEFGWNHLHGKLNTNYLSLPMLQLEGEAFEGEILQYPVLFL